MVLAMVKRTNESQRGEGVLPGTQKELLLHILQHGPSAAYGTHKLLKKAQSTVQTSMTRLEDAGLVTLYSEEKSKKGGKKLMYGLTPYGFCYGFYLIVRSETTTYDLIERLISRWQQLCPEVLGNWDLLVKERQGMRPSLGNSRINNHGWQDEQLPYQVPSIEAKYWIIFLDEICRDRIANHKRGGTHQPKNLTPEGFTEIFIETICILLENRPGMFPGTPISHIPEIERMEFFDVPYMIRIIREIPNLWDPWLLGHLIGLKKRYEISAIQIWWLLEELGCPSNETEYIRVRVNKQGDVVMEDLEELIQQRREISNSES